jgi:hypothetical protein
MGTIYSDLMTTIKNPIKSLLPQNLLETGLGPISDVTRPYVRAAAKYLDFMKPTSDAAKLSAMNPEDRIKRVEKDKLSIIEDAQSPYYPKADGGIITLRSKYEYKK